MTLHTDTPERFDAARRSLGGGWSIGTESDTVSRPLLIERIVGDSR